jgi:hypothetical protein
LGVVLVLSGLFHLGVQVVDGGAWAGPVSWRKPVVFGLSLGLLNLTLAWILSAFSLRVRSAWAIVAALGVGSVAETFLISLQRWRGVASHFNDTTSFDGAVWMAMGMMIALVVVPTAVLLVRSLGPLDATPSRAMAIRAGLALLLAGYLVGGFMMLAGPSGAGALAPTHALALHGLQALLVADVLVGRTRRSPSGRARAVTMASVAWAALVVASLGGAMTP